MALRNEFLRIGEIPARVISGELGDRDNSLEKC